MTQAQLADAVEIGRSTIASIEAGYINPSVALAKRIGETLGFDWVLLFDEKSMKDGASDH